MDHYGKTARKQNPREKANIFSLLTFSYTGGLFKKGVKRDLIEDDIYDVVGVCGAKRNGDSFEKKWSLEQQRKNPSIIHLLWVCFGIRYTFLGLIHLFAKLINSIYEPESIGKLVSYFNPNQTKLTFNDAVYYACVMIGLKLFHTFYFQNYVIYLQQLAIQIRTSFCSLIYRKALKLTPTAMNEISLGNIITVITKDVLVFEQSIFLFNDMWIEIIRIGVICYLIYNKMGPAGFVGIAVLLTVVPAQVYVGKMIKNLRLDLSKKTDERLQATQETLSAIKIIKMYTWEKVFCKKVEEKRTKEMKFLMKSFYLRSLNFIIGIFTSKVGFYALIMTYIYINVNADAEVIFYVMKNFKDLRHSIAILIPIGLGRGAELVASSTRINKVLKCPEVEEENRRDYEKPKLKLQDVSLKIKNKEILKNVSIELGSGLTVVTGPLGCGKSALLKVFLKDYQITDGKIFSEGVFSYCSQDPWLFPSSIKQNILFGEPYYQDRYDAVIKVCALQYDFDLLERGDETIVADRGINLSGGQQARINLARAIYRKSDIYLLDDPLHALDPAVQEYIFQKCIRGFLKGERCVMVTHNLKHKNNADNLVVMHEGEIVFDGKPQDVKNEILEEIAIADQKAAKKVETDDGDENADETTRLINRKIAKRKVYSEVKKEGKVDFAVYRKYFSFGGGFFLFAAIASLFISDEFTDSYSSRLLTDWINLQQKATNLLLEDMLLNASFGIGTAYPNNNDTVISAIERQRRDIAAVSNDSSMFSHEAILNVTTPVNYSETILFEMTEVPLFVNNTGTADTVSNLQDRAKWTLKLYSAMIVLSLVIDLVKQFLFLHFARKASVNLHNTMIERLTTATMSFFDTYFIGNILNRFSQDLNVVDEHLPHTINMFVMVVLSSTGILVLVASVNLQFLIPASILVVTLFCIRTVYMPTARSLKRLEAATRSPLIGHLNASMEGVTTIRASKAQEILIKEFDRHQDLYTSAHYMTFCIRRAFGFFMDIMSTMFSTIVVAKLLFFSTGEASGDVGLAITKAAALAGLVQWALMQWSDLENDMTSVERVLEYTEVPQDHYGGEKLNNWPNNGTVTYKNVSLAYKDEKVLKNINFEVQPKQKIGIVGRTGAGKSSIISTLFRLYTYEGDILVDGINIKSMALDYYRDRISIIPQDPLLFQGTIRNNIDPFHRYSDEEVWQALDKVHMKDHVRNLELTITDHGSNFSTGQRQLICLARAIIKKNKIVVLDEATSNMDPDTEFLVQKVIADQFVDCTVFIIAHRLQSVLDCNFIIVMEKGEIVEFDEPLHLIENKNSYFASMLQADNTHLYDK